MPEHGHYRHEDKVLPNPTSSRMSHLQLLRSMHLHVPGLDASELPSLTARQIGDCAQGSSPPTRIQGHSSTIDVTFSDNSPDSIRTPAAFSVRKWADVFESDVIIRLCITWNESTSKGDVTLGVTTTPFFTNGKEHPQLRNDVLYNTALASALLGDNMTEDQYHVFMSLNSAIDWHFDTQTRAPRNKYDLATTILHELTHGLFFSGTAHVPSNARIGVFSRHPGRFDEFMEVEGNIGVARSCKKGDDLFNAFISPNLRFLGSSSEANFGLYAPFPFDEGSSVYHFNNTKSLRADCSALGIAMKDCSDLMTHELVSGYTQRDLGETTLRVYRAMRSSALGRPNSRVCNVPNYYGRETYDEEDEDSTFNLPTWGIYVVAGVAGLGVFLVLGAIASSMKTRPVVG